VERSGQISVQNEQQLKSYYGSPEAAGQVISIAGISPSTHISREDNLSADYS